MKGATIFSAFLLLWGAWALKNKYEADGLARGVFYAKGRRDVARLHPRIRRALENIHSLGPEDATWLALAFGLPVAAALFAMGFVWSAVPAAAIAGYGWFLWGDTRYQVWINRGCGLPDFDPNEHPRSEVDVGRWIPKPLHGERRRWAPWVCLALHLLAGGLLTLDHLIL